MFLFAVFGVRTYRKSPICSGSSSEMVTLTLL